MMSDREDSAAPEAPTEEAVPTEGAPPAEEAPADADTAEEAPTDETAPAEEAAAATEDGAAHVEDTAPPGDEAVADQAPADEPAAHETGPADEPGADEAAPVGEPVADEVPADEPGADEVARADEPAADEVAPADEPAADQAPADEPPADEAGAGEEAAPADEVPAEDTAPAEEAPAEEPAVAEDIPAEAGTADEAPAEEAAPAEVPAAGEQPAPADDAAKLERSKTPENGSELPPIGDGEVAEVKLDEGLPPQKEEVENFDLVAEGTGAPSALRPPQSPPAVQDIDAPAGAESTEMAAQTKVPDSTLVQQEPTATVKLILMPSGQTVTKTLPLRVALSAVVETLAGELRMPPDVLELLFNGKVVELSFRLEDYGIEANGTVAFEVSSKDPNSFPIREFVQRAPVGGMADVITVRIQMDDGARDVVVEIERSEARKPFLGGYRHKRTGAVYHHALTQTNPKARPISNVERFSRDTQTWEGRHKVQMTFNTTSTQMTRPGVFVSNITDRLVVPGRYECADDYHTRVLAKVIVLQRYLRAWLAKRYVENLREEKNKRLAYEKLEEMKKRKEKEDRIRKAFERRMNPKTKEDFDLLYNALEKWRQEELARINSTMSGAERKAALYLLLEQETELIAAIDRHQLDANAENKERGIQQLLSKAAAAKKWRDREGKLLEMDTPYTLRGKELLDIYNSLSMRYLTQDERLDVLLTLKHTVKEHDCKLTQEIVELIDREADLLMRGVKEENLSGLRRRISTLFLQYVKTPVFNPEMARLLKVPQDPSVLRQDIHFCVSCGRYLQSTEFSMGIKSTGIGRCRRCLRKDNLARSREDQSAYKYLLQELRRAEEACQDDGRIAFLIEEADVRYLVDNIWEGMSILSSWNDLADLELVRWNYAGEWSPWNTVLLTKDEAEAHRKLKDLDKAYGSMLVHRVKQKHVLAKNYFHKLKAMAEKMRRRELELENVRQTTK